jgi:hypothetical protein
MFRYISSQSHRDIPRLRRGNVLPTDLITTNRLDNAGTHQNSTPHTMKLTATVICISAHTFEPVEGGKWCDVIRCMHARGIALSGTASAASFVLLQKNSVEKTGWREVAGMFTCVTPWAAKRLRLLTQHCVRRTKEKFRHAATKRVSQLLRLHVEATQRPTALIALYAQHRSSTSPLPTTEAQG